MTERKWHKGPPPYVGWWNASDRKGLAIWRWWDGFYWSISVLPTVRAAYAANWARRRAYGQGHIEWSDYYPANARVPRIAP